VGLFLAMRFEIAYRWMAVRKVWRVFDNVLRTKGGFKWVSPHLYSASLNTVISCIFDCFLSYK
jgi:hypothetical protein